MTSKRSSRTIIFVAAVIALMTLSVIYTRGSRTLYYSGPISSVLVDKIQKFPIGKLDRIVIDSKGGEFPAALDAASVIQENGIQIVVDGYCLSACASIILPAGRDNIVKPNSLIGFHNLPGMWFYLDKYTAANYELSLKELPVYPDSKRTIDIFLNAEINPDIFVALALSKGMNCFAVDKELGPSVNFSSDLVVPNKRVFEQFNWKFEEFDMPNDQASLEKLIIPLRLNNPDLKVKILEEDFRYPVVLTEGDIGFTQVPQCLD